MSAASRRTPASGGLRVKRGGSAPACLTEIARAIHLSLAATSEHLKLLEAADIVVTRKRGLFVTYRLSLDQQSPVREVLRLL